jgi:hypothetical protein
VDVVGCRRRTGGNVDDTEVRRQDMDNEEIEEVVELGYAEVGALAGRIRDTHRLTGIYAVLIPGEVKDGDTVIAKNGTLHLVIRRCDFINYMYVMP